MTWKHETFTFTFMNSFFHLVGTPLTCCPQGVDTTNLRPLLPGWLLLMLFFNLQWECWAATARLVADDVVLQSRARPPLPPPPRHRPSSWGCHLTGQMNPTKNLPSQKQCWRAWLSTSTIGISASLSKVVILYKEQSAHAWSWSRAVSLR